MRDFKNAMIACACVIVLSIAGIAIWTVRVYLPLFGFILLVVMVIGVLLALVYAVEHLHRRFTRYDHIQISQYGSVLHRRNQLVEIAPYHPGPAIRASHQEEPDVIEGEIEEADEMPALLPALLTFSQLLDRGIIQAALAQGQMILGYYADSHQLRYGSWLDLYSAGNGGVSGSGKSTTTRFLLFQAILAQAKLIMIDPHINNPAESLSYQFSLLPQSVHQIRPCDGADTNVMKRAEWLDREMKRRMKTNLITPGLVFVIDEFNAVMRKASKEVKEKLTKLLLDIEQEGRKFGIFALLIGQRWSAQDLGGADIRTSLASKMAHRFSDEDQAKRFIGSKHARALLELETGHWLFYDTKGKTSEMVTPETLAEDGAMVARYIGQPGREITPEISLKPREITRQIPETTGRGIIAIGPRNLEETSDFEPETSAETSEETTHIEELARLVIRLQADGKQKPDIMREVWNVNPGANEPYRRAQAEYQEIMAYIAEQLGA